MSSLEHSPDAIILIDPHDPQVSWPIVACNQGACRMNGYTQDELIGQSVDLLNAFPTDLQDRAAYLERLRRKGMFQIEAIHRRKDGSLFPIEILSSLISVAGRELVLGVDRDITDRKRAEEALRVAEARYRTLVEQIPAITYTADINAASTTSYVSPQIEAILGFTPTEWLADPEIWLKQIHPDDRARVLDAINCAQASDQPIPAEYRSFTRDGHVVWLQDASKVVRDEMGRPLFLQGITLDITARKHMENALQEREAHFRALIEHSTDAIGLVAIDGTLLYASPATVRVLGYTTQELIGRSALDLIHPEDQPEIAGHLAHVVGQVEASISVEARVRHADGSWRDLEGRLTNLLNDPAVGAVVINYRDITERKQAQAALAEERELLARRVEERTADLSAANADLARLARLKDEFLASMSHELRTPLNAILGLSEALQEEVYGPLNERQGRSLQGIEESGRHLLALINDILDLSKIEAGKMELELEPTPIATICQASLRLVKEAAQKKRLTVNVTIDPALSMIVVDARRLKQILVNLLSNAVKFTPESGSIGLEVRGDAAHQVVHLTVWDTGIGIAPEQMPHLFQPFVQLDSRLARQYEGTGLGLALVYRMVEKHGGSVVVSSEVGIGSRFTIALPWRRLEAEHGAAEQPMLDHTARAAVRRALIVEDSPTAADQIARYLQELGVMTVIHPHGADAVAYAIECQPDLIILDILLPDVLGWDVLTQLKAEPRTQAIPIVIMSVVDDRQQGLTLGAAGYLVKPVTRDGIEQILRTLTPGEGSRLGELVQLVPERDHAPMIVLLAEDNEANIAMISDFLSARGYRVVAARNGIEAIARAREIRPAIILMDIQMPGMDGLEATRRIRADSDLGTMPIIALTALAMPGDRERCLAAGANDYLSKPVSLKGLATQLEAYL